MTVSDNRPRRRKGRTAERLADLRWQLHERLVAGCDPGVRLRLQRGQSIDIAAPGARTIWLIESGCVVLQLPLKGRRRQVLLVLLPGDMFDAAWAEEVPGLGLMATTASQVLRTQMPSACDAAADRDRDAEAARGELNRQTLAALMLHLMCIGRLTGEERIAAFLLSFERRRSEGGPAARAAAVPLSRRDLADCLGLNPDTVSRILSAMRRQRLLTQPSRNEIVIKDVEALRRISSPDAG